MGNHGFHHHPVGQSSASPQPMQCQWKLAKKEDLNKRQSLVTQYPGSGYKQKSLTTPRSRKITMSEKRHSTHTNTKTIQMLLCDKEFKTGIIKMFQQAITNPLTKKKISTKK